MLLRNFYVVQIDLFLKIYILQTIVQSKFYKVRLDHVETLLRGVVRNTKLLREPSRTHVKF